MDLTVIVALVLVVVLIASQAPPHTYRFAQVWQVGAAMDLAQGGNWLMPRQQDEGIFKKPPLYAWMLAPLLKLTGAYNDLVYRIPAILGGIGTVVLIYLLTLRWLGRRIALITGVLWPICLHMSKLLYLALTDMPLTFFITASIFCVDRVLFHPAPKRMRKYWLVGLWATILLGAFTKGWGVANIPLVAGFVALGAGMGPGFGVLSRIQRPGDKLLVFLRLIAHRLWTAIKAVRLQWGIIAYLLLMGPYLAALFAWGGEEFRYLFRYEVIQRITGSGQSPPKSSSWPPVAYLLVRTLPISVFAVGALALVGVRRWFGRSSPIVLPLSWILAVLIPYSLSHGFRPDYLLPCYGAVAMLAAWAIDRAIRQGKAGARGIHAVHHGLAASVIITGLLVAIVSQAYLSWDLAPDALRDVISMPYYVAPTTWALLPVWVGIGVTATSLAIYAGLTWRTRLLVGLLCVVSLGMHFLDRYMNTEHAVTGDGVKIRRFAKEVDRIAQDEPLHMYYAAKLCVEPYLGRFGQRIPARIRYSDETAEESHRRVVSTLNQLTGKLLITCDRGLAALGTGELSKDGNFELHRSVWYQTHPEQLGDVIVETPPIREERWGRIYLIRLKDRIDPNGQPMFRIGSDPDESAGD